MTSPIKKILFVITGLLLILLGVYLYLNFSEKDEKTLWVNFLDIGQGDAIYIRTPGDQDILIDGGPDARVLEGLGKYMPFYDRKIELVILTHGHADHVAGLNEILKRYEVDLVLYPGDVDYQASDYEAFKEIIAEEDIPLAVATAGQVYQLGEDLSMDIYFPFADLSGQKMEDINDSSVISRLVYGDIAFLFTGDAGIEVEKKLINSEQELLSNVLKVGHHGSKYSSSEEFIELVDPECGIIQCGVDNDFDHPHKETLELFEKEGINVLRNDLEGDIVCEAD
ncbi:MAG: MBL fold metallo-hydrolase, partial [Patescibacteria group bacterium]